ncbi:hypothetical protein [Thiohalobacter sp.]|uniref:hypothetical protein n=1 Tax=Thiohalobacter sp. TaxID=2025948 RepID=UPI00260CB0AA|nr:hypothetical protein [Thiohalobacter sp.]
MTWRRLLLMIALSCTTSVQARDLNGNYAVFGAGGRTCADYLQARDQGGEAALAFAQWVAGHLSAYNLLLDKTYNILGEVTPFQLMAELDAYCREARDLPFVQALALHLEKLYEVRANLSPNQPSNWKGWLEEMARGRKGE